MGHNGETRPGIGGETVYKEYKGPIDIFVPKGQEAAYLAQHDIEIRKLSNGVSLSGVTRRVEDTAHATANFRFPSGAYREPIGKQGINHLVEHLVANNPGYTALKTDGYFNAYTSFDSLLLVASGIVNPHVTDYGLWPILPVIAGQLAQPFSLTDEELAHEKNVIAREIQRRNLDHVQQAGRLLGLLSHSAGNPLNYETIGTEASVRGITREDVITQHANIFIPNGLEISVKNEGDPQTTKILLDRLEETYGSMSNTDKRPAHVADSYDNGASPFTLGGIYTADTGIPNQQVSVSYFWPGTNNGYSVETEAEVRLHAIAHRRLIEFFRSRGYGYDTPTQNAFTPRENEAMVGFDIIVSNNRHPLQFKTEVLPELQENVIGGISDDEIDFEVELTQKRMSAQPISSTMRYDVVMQSLKDFGRIIDPEKAQEISRMVTPQQLRDARDRILNTNPTIFVIGDLSPYK